MTKICSKNNEFVVINWFQENGWNVLKKIWKMFCEKKVVPARGQKKKMANVVEQH